MPLPRFHKLEPAKQKELLDAAAAELAEKGFEGASIAAIVERAGASKSAVYYYFEDKADLVRTVLEQSMEEVSEVVGDLDDEAFRTNFWDALRAKKMRAIAHFEGRPDQLAIWRIAAELGTCGEQATSCVSQVHEQMRERWRPLLALGRESGQLRDDLCEELCIDLVMSVDGTLQHYSMNALARLEPDEKPEFHHYVEQFLDLLRRLLSPAGETGSPS